MASNKMLIDASHPEETRVAVVRGNRIEEFDFESQAKKQLRGNIYLAKVTRVEPSLQAAFIDYGGNRHGFLAFSEIHPDYYQIPMADRQALLDEEARDAEEAEEPEPKPKPARRRRSRKSSAADESNTVEEAAADGQQDAVDSKAGDTNTETGDKSVTDDEAAVEVETAAEEDNDESEAGEEVEVNDQTTVAEETAEDTPETSDDDDGKDGEEGSDDDTPERTIAAAYETDSISEPAPDGDGDGDGDGDEPENDGSEDKSEKTAAVSSDEEVKPAAKEKPKRRSRRKPKAAATDDIKKKSEAADEEPAAENETVSESVESAPEESVETAADANAPEVATDPEDAAVAETSDSNDDKPKRRTSTRGRKNTTRRRRAKPQGDEDSNEAQSEGVVASSDEENGDDDVESVGQEDALEEVPHRRKPRRQYKIQEVIKRRQVMLVQVVKEERGNKGAALTTYLSLAGRYSVLMPNTARGGGISRKITNVADRKRLKAIASELDVQKGMGVILRTAGASRTKAEIKRDFEYLMRLWENVRELTLSSTAPCLVYEEGSLIKRSIRDLYDKNIEEVLVSGDYGYREAKEFMRMLMPSHAKNVKEYTEDLSIFSRFSVEQQLDRLVTPQVTLKSGGYLVINQTEALVSIDVNSGRSTREHSIEDTALQTNLEAADEIARQLRLRDLAGLIVIDFIDMEEKRNNRAVEKRIKDALKNDRARIQVGRISHFGLLEMSRQRIRASVMESTMDICPHCDGAGHIRSSSSIALHVFRSIEDHLTRHSRHDVIVRCPVLISVNILNNKRTELVELEQRFGVRVSIEADENLPGQSFTIERGEPSSRPKAQHVPVHQEIEDETSHAQQSEEDAGEDGPRRKRRRRGRGRRDDGQSNIGAAEEAESTDTEASADSGSNDSPIGDDSGDERPKKRRRRGKRGGRRNRQDETESVEGGSSQVDPDTESANAGVNAGEKPETPTPAAIESNSSPAELANVVTVGEDVKSEMVAEKAEPNGRGRNTRRPRSAASQSAEQSKPAATDVVEDAPESAPEPAEEKTDNTKPKRKKSGWWSRGGGFFN